MNSRPLKQIQSHLILGRKLVFIAGALSAAIATRAQIAVTDISYGTATNAGNTSQGGINYDNRIGPLSNVPTVLGE